MGTVMGEEGAGEGVLPFSGTRLIPTGFNSTGRVCYDSTIFPSQPPHVGAVRGTINFVNCSIIVMIF